eukprot:TRINITY_DN63793_c0_g1_i1.p1 TRINITY_DN63793_c0_g1~~TRINITY_DN63793_c0_g1_i1.p1  ORF type:complete len:215 (-),score=40.74 TRINITY_DN63793_c0_g1_i1:76-669(-)
MGRPAAAVPTRRSSRNHQVVVPSRVTKGSRAEARVHATPRSAASATNCKSKVFRPSPSVQGRHYDDDVDLEDHDLRCKAVQDAIWTRAAGILERFQEESKCSDDPSDHGNLAELPAVMKQLVEAESNRGNFLRSLRGDLEAIAADLRAQVASQAVAAARSQVSSLGARGPSALGGLGLSQATTRSGPAGRSKRTLRD